MALNAGQHAGGIRVTYRASCGAVVDMTLDRLRTDEVIAGLGVAQPRVCCLVGRHDSGRVADQHGAGVPQRIRGPTTIVKTAAFVSGANSR